MNLTKKTVVYKLKWEFKIIILLLIIAVFILFMKNLYFVLSPNKEIETKYLVVEAWMSDYAFEESLKIFRDKKYHHIFTTGGPLNTGYYLNNYKSTADAAKETFLLLGCSNDSITSVSRDLVWNDRTYHTALELKAYLKTNYPQIKSFNLVSLGPHSARSWLLFKKAMPEYEIGIISLDDKLYKKDKWWTNSKGFRSVLTEGIGYFYVLLFFKSYGV